MEKSLKQSRNLFCNRGGGGCTEHSSGISGLLSLVFLSYRGGAKNTVAISIGPRFTVVPNIIIITINTNKKYATYLN